jgi:hypothetical protein
VIALYFVGVAEVADEVTDAGLAAGCELEAAAIEATLILESNWPCPVPKEASQLPPEDLADDTECSADDTESRKANPKLKPETL